MSLDALKALEERIDKTLETINQLKKAKEHLEGENTQLREEISTLNNKIRLMEEKGGDIGPLQNENSKLKSAQDELRIKLGNIIGKLEKLQQ